MLSLLYDLRISGAETIKEIVREANRCESDMPSLTKGSLEITMTVPKKGVWGGPSSLNCL